MVKRCASCDLRKIYEQNVNNAIKHIVEKKMGYISDTPLDKNNKIEDGETDQNVSAE